MNENEFEISGRVFVPAENHSEDGSSCIGCAMHELKVCPQHVKSDDVPNCHGTLRMDRRNVIFVEKGL